MSLLAANIPVQAVSLLVGDNGVATHLGLFASELFGTFILILLGAGVVAGVSLPNRMRRTPDGLSLLLLGGLRFLRPFIFPGLRVRILTQRLPLV